MIIEAIKFAEYFPKLLNPCKVCNKEECKISKKDNFQDISTFNEFAEKHFDCFVNNILTRCLYPVQSQTRVKHYFKDNDECKVDTKSCLRVIKTNSPIDLTIHERGRVIPIEIKKFEDKYDYIGLSNFNNQFTPNSLIVFPGEQSSIGQHFTDFIKVIRFLSITSSKIGYLIQFLSNDRPSYLWDTINSFNNNGIVVIFGETATDWYNYPIWGCLSFNVLNKSDNSIEFQLTKPSFQDIDIFLISKYLHQRNRFYTFDNLLKKILENYDKQYDLRSNRYILSKSRKIGELATLDIFRIKKIITKVSS